MKIKNYPKNPKLPKQRDLQEDELDDFYKLDMLHDFAQLGEEHAPVGFQANKGDDSIVNYRLEFDEKTKFPRVFESIRID